MVRYSVFLLTLNGNRYAWSSGNTGMSGRLYARVARKRGCLADTSRTIRRAMSGLDVTSTQISGESL